MQINTQTARSAGHTYDQALFLRPPAPLLSFLIPYNLSLQYVGAGCLLCTGSWSRPTDRPSVRHHERGDSYLRLSVCHPISRHLKPISVSSVPNGDQVKWMRTELRGQRERGTHILPCCAQLEIPSRKTLVANPTHHLCCCASSSLHMCADFK